VIGINYGSSDPTNTSQYFAVPAELARGVVDTHAEGIDVESLGKRGEQRRGGTRRHPPESGWS
jgi:hypothetical protein